MGLSDDAVRGIQQSIAPRKKRDQKLLEDDGWPNVEQEIKDFIRDRINEMVNLQNQHYTGLVQNEVVIENQLREKRSHGNQEAEA